MSPTALPADQPIGEIEQVFAFHGAPPTGVSVSPDNRIAVSPSPLLRRGHRRHRGRCELQQRAGGKQHA
jgi:hypothetical protein